MATAAAEKSWEDLPDECWDIIFTSIDHHRHFEPLSLVNKRFLALTDHLRTTLTVPGHFLTLSPAALYSRFRRLHSVTLADPHPDIDGFVRGLAGAALPLVSLHFSDQSHFPRDAVRTLPETIRSLSCARFREISDADLAVIADCFPYLERLDVSYPKLTGGAAGGVTDAGVIRISVKLRSLISLDVSGNVLISKRSIAHVGSNCALLRELKARDCAYFGDFSIESALLEAAKIASLSTLELSSAFFVNLSLQQLSGLKTKLEKLVLLSTGVFTNVDLLFQFLRSCTLLRYVHLQYVVFSSHLMAGDIAASMVNVEVVKFDYCVGLTDSHFFAIMSACRNLQEISVSSAEIGGESQWYSSIIFCWVRKLVLRKCRFLTDEFLIQIGSACPRLESLDVSHCEKITGWGIVKIMKNCRNIKELKWSFCIEVKDLDLDVELPKLEMLDAAQTGIGDKWLSSASKTCKSLFKLEIGGSAVTLKGLKALVSKHEQLRELSLASMYDNFKLSSSDLASLVISRVGLKKIILPDRINVTDAQREFFLKHGCLVLAGSRDLHEDEEPEPTSFW